MASRRRRRKSIGKVIVDVERRVRRVEKRPGAKRLKTNVVTTEKLGFRAVTTKVIQEDAVTANEAAFGVTVVSGTDPAIVKEGTTVVDPGTGGQKVYSEVTSTFVDVTDPTAQATADSKSATFYQDNQPAGTAYEVGDMWVDTNDNDKLYVWDGAVWSLAQDSASASSAASAAAADAAAAASAATTAYNAAVASLQPSAYAIGHPTTKQLTTIDTAGVTVYSGGSATEGSRVILNSLGLTAYARINVTNAVGNGTTVTYTASGHSFGVGTTVTITGLAPSGYNGTFVITAVVAGSTFTVANTTTATLTDSNGFVEAATLAISASTGNAIFAGSITGSTIVGGTLNIAGNATIDSAGVLTATGANITGTINASAGTFSGTITASGTISGGTISGAVITGSLFTSTNYAAGSGIAIASGATGETILFSVAGAQRASIATVAGGMVLTSGASTLTLSYAGSVQLTSTDNALLMSAAPYFMSGSGANTSGGLGSIRNTWASSGDPSGGNLGDVWLKWA